MFVFYAFSTVGVDRDLGLALGAAVAASWLVLGLSYGYAIAVTDERAERGALTLAAAFPNTGFVGFPLAQIALGNPGLALMVVRPTCLAHPGDGCLDHDRRASTGIGMPGLAAGGACGSWLRIRPS